MGLNDLCLFHKSLFSHCTDHSRNSLVAATLWPKVFFPNLVTQEFNLHVNDLENERDLLVRGMKIQNQTSGSFETGSSSAHSLVVASSIFPPNRPVFKRSKPMECTVKITKASLKQASSGKPEFRFQAQIFIEAIEDTANVTYLNSMVQGQNT